jgi:D-3-phosphoglycerate dehydrogenase
LKIAIPEDYQNAVSELDCLSLLDGHEVTIYNMHFGNTDEAAEKLKDAEALVLIRERTEIGEELLARLPRLKLISQTGKISNHLDLAACSKYGVAVAEGIGSPIAPAELTWALIMNASRRIPQAIADMKAGLWQTNIGTALHGQTIGIWGYGKIGRLIAGYARAFGMRVMVWGREESRRKAAEDGCIAADSKQQFFRQADILTLHLRLVAATTAIVKAEDLALMKSTAILVNTSRAELIEEGALINALRAGHPGFAALDVYDSEPLVDKNHPLLQMPNVLCTPHLGYVEKQGYELYFSKAFENIVAYANGVPVNIANPEVLRGSTTTTDGNT